MKKTVLEDSDKYHDSRTGSTITVTDDVTSVNSIQSLERTSDQPLLKPHPFSFGLNSFSNSLRSLSCIDAVTDIHVHRQTFAETTNHHSFDNERSLPNTLSQIDSDWYSILCNSQTIKETNADNYQINFTGSQQQQLHLNQSGFSFPSTFNRCPSSNHFLYQQSPVSSNTPLQTRPKCICSIDSSDSSTSEPATDSGQFSDLETYQKSRNCLVHKTSLNDPSTAHTKSHTVTNNSCPSNTRGLSNALYRNKLDRCTEDGCCSPIPGIRITSSLDDTPNIRSTKVVKSAATNTCIPNHSNRYSNLRSTIQPLPNRSTMSLSLNASFNLSASSPNMLDYANHSKDGISFAHNKSWTGLPLLDGACSELDSNVCNPHLNNGDSEEDAPISLKV